MTEQQYKDKQAVKEIKWYAALQEGNKKALAISRQRQQALNSNMHQLRPGNFSQLPLFNTGNKLSPRINKQKLHNSSSKQEQNIAVAAEETRMGSGRVIADAAAPVNNRTVTDGTTGERIKLQERERREGIQIPKVGSGHRSGGITAAKEQVLNINYKKQGTTGKYGFVPRLIANTKGTDKRKDELDGNNVLQDAGKSENDGKAFADVVNLKSIAARPAQLMQRKQEAKRNSSGNQHYLTAVNDILKLTNAGAAVMNTQRNSAVNVAIPGTIATKSKNGKLVDMPLLKSGYGPSNIAKGSIEHMHAMSTMKNAPTLYGQQANGIGEKMTGVSTDAGGLVKRNESKTAMAKKVEMYMNQPVIGSLTINCADTNEAVTDIRNKVEEALLAILESANAIH
jgi:hypothetical protein